MNRYTYCTVQRTFERRHGTLALGTGAITMTRAETVTEACNVPLFGEDGNTGVCRACRNGWTVPGNVFASEAERARAMAAVWHGAHGKGPCMPTGGRFRDWPPVAVP